MTSFWRIFSLEWKALRRSKTTAMLTVASVVWMFAFPHLVRGDGTEAGARELYLHFSLGGVFALLVVALLATAAGSLAKERAEKRLQLALTRPASRFALAFGRIVAQVAVGALVLFLASVVLLVKTDPSVRCNHVLSPVLPTPQEEALTMYDAFMKDPETPPSVKKAKKSAVLRLLAQRAIDHYQTVPTNETVRWTFPAAGDAIRLRFTNPMEMRQSVQGVFSSGAASLAVSNITQAVVTYPFRGETGELAFANQGTSALMLRPRRDINLLAAGDAFRMNLLRTYLALVSVLSLLIATGTLLSAGLGRPVALFVAFVALLVGEMSPSVIEQYPDELDANFVDRMGLAITRVAAEVTRPVSALSPLEPFAKDECVEWNDVLKLALVDLAALPVALALLAAFVMPRKQDDLV